MRTATSLYLSKKVFLALTLVITLLAAWLFGMVYKGSENNMNLTRDTLLHESIYHYELLKNITIAVQENNHTITRHGWNFREDFPHQHYGAEFIPFQKMEENSFASRAKTYLDTHPEEDYYYELPDGSLERFDFAGRIRNDGSCFQCHSKAQIASGELSGLIRLDADTRQYNENYLFVQHRRTAVMLAIVLIAAAAILFFWFIYRYSQRHVNDENEKKRLMQNMVELANQELQSITNAMADGVYILDNQHNLTYINPAGEAILEYHAGELMGRKTHEVFHYQDRHGNRIGIEECPIHKVFTEKARYISDEEIFTAKSGRIVPVHVSATPIKSNGNINGVVVVFQDVTSRKKSERRLKEYNSRLTELYEKERKTKQEQDSILLQQAKLAAVGEMIGAIAHQWRQPLNIISLVTQDIQDAWDYKEMDEHFLHRSITGIKEQIRFMSETIESFRNLIKPDHTYTHFNLIQATKELLKMLSTQLVSHGIRVDIFLQTPDLDLDAESYRDLEDDLQCAVFGGANEYKQVLLNLINNAKEVLIEHRTEHPHIRLSLSCQPEDVTITVEDNGPGIAPEVLEHLFQPYITTKGDAGTGIGLYVCKKIMEKMEGKIEGSNSERGGRFILHLKKRAD